MEPGRCKNCKPERLAEAAGSFGASATTPMLWIYAANERFSASLGRKMQLFCRCWSGVGENEAVDGAKKVHLPSR
jgi:hypothetical protein